MSIHSNMNVEAKLNTQRRTVLKGAAALSVFSIAAITGLVSPRSVLAAWPEQSFGAKSLDSALNSLFGTTDTKAGKITIKAPEIAENGAVVPVTVSTGLANIKRIALFVEKNPQPLTCSYDFAGNLEGYIATRIKMGETSDIVAAVETNEGIFTARKTVKVTIGGCGG